MKKIELLNICAKHFPSDIEKSGLEVMSLMRGADIEGDQDWENETTTYEIDDCFVIVNNDTVCFQDKGE